jgi:UDP-2-acetamido-3-amino-2,3-dideoxy-glucuronate N-acetyltransferase
MSYVHPTAEVSDRAVVGPGTKIWRAVHVREDASIGSNCVIGAGVYVGEGVQVGDNCKVQNQALLYEGLTLEDGVFVGPQVCFTNDYLPRAINRDGSLKSADDWTLGHTTVRYGASVGARSVIVTGITIGRFALVGAGSVVTRDVPDHALVFGSPAKIQGWVCACGRRLRVEGAAGHCEECGNWTELAYLAAEAAGCGRPPESGGGAGRGYALTLSLSQGEREPCTGPRASSFIFST